MKKQPLLAALAALSLAATPALAFPVVRPTERMISVPYFGASRVSTVSMCLTDAGVRRYSDLITDSQWDTFTDCMTDNT